MLKGKKLLRSLVFVCLTLCTAAPASAAEKSITIGLISDTLFMDPHQQQELVTTAITRHIYDPLLAESADGSKLEPMLAESWELAPDQLTWTFKLRKGVKFSDGSPFTAEDVKYSIWRTAQFLGKTLVMTIGEVVIVDPHTVKLITKAPDGALPDKLAKLCIMSKAYTTKVGDEAVNLKPMGTGPYVLAEWVKQDHISLALNPNYWGRQPAIANVRFKPISNAATRTAALLSGEVDLADDIPVRDLARLQKTKGMDLVVRPGRRLIYMQIDGTREPTPGIDGPKNPMKDLRVRQAISLGIDRRAIVKITLNGNGYPTGQLVQQGKRGNIPGLPVPEYNPKKAKQLLKEAGYEQGFALRMDGPVDSYLNDAQVVQAIAGQLAKIGIKVEPILHPRATFLAYVRRGEKTSLVMAGWPEEMDFGAMGNIFYYTRGKNPAKGGSNRCHYSNPAFDKLLDDADATADIARRTQLLEEAARLVLHDVGVIPLYFSQDIYGKKNTIKFTPRANKFIMADELDIEG